MKAKKIAKRLRARARQLHQLAGSFQDGGQVVDRAGLLAEVLQEVAEQISPRPKGEGEAKKEAKKDSKNYNAELHGKILGFLMTEWARKDNRQLVGVDLLFAPGGGFREEPIRKWERADEPDLFAEFVNVEKLVTQIIEIAEGEVDAKPVGKHRFIVRTHQHLGERASMSFALSPSYTGGDEPSVRRRHNGDGAKHERGEDRVRIGARG